VCIRVAQFRPWVVAEGCGSTNAEAAEGVDPSRAGLAASAVCQACCLRCSGMSLSVAGPAWWTKAVALRVQGPCGRASQSRRPWVVAASCGAANAEAPTGVHPSRSGLRLLPQAVAQRMQRHLWACIRVAQALGCCQRLWRSDGRASESRRPWVAAWRRGWARA
jgi:hypothetical protein